eukprot:sb/3467814/
MTPLAVIATTQRAQGISLLPGAATNHPQLVVGATVPGLRDLQETALAGAVKLSMEDGVVGATLLAVSVTMLPELATAQRRDHATVHGLPVGEQVALAAHIVVTTAPAAVVKLSMEDGVVGATLLAVSATMLPELDTAQKQDPVTVQRPTVGDQVALVARLVETTAPAAVVKLSMEDGVVGATVLAVSVTMLPELDTAQRQDPVTVQRPTVGEQVAQVVHIVKTTAPAAVLCLTNSDFLPFFAHFQHLLIQITAKRLEIELKSPTTTPHKLAIAYKMAPMKSL